MAQTSVSVNAREHSDRETSRHRKKKILRNKHLKHDDNSLAARAPKKAKISKFNTSPVVQETKNVQHTNSKKLFDARSENSRIKKKKRKVDFDDVKVGADVSSWKNESDSVADTITNTTDSVETPSASLECDLQHLEDYIVDDVVSVNIMVYSQLIPMSTQPWSTRPQVKMSLSQLGPQGKPNRGPNSS